VTKDKSEHHLLERPRNNPTRTAFGVAAMTCYGMFWLGGGNDIIATQFHVSLNGVTYFLRVAVFVAPVIAFIITKRICISLQRSDIDRLLHGAESGVIDRSPDGGYAERHVPVSDEEAFMLTEHQPRKVAELEAGEDEYGVSTGKGGLKERMRVKASGFYYADQPEKLTSEELAEAKKHILGHGDHDDHGELEAGESNGSESEQIEAGEDEGEEVGTKS